MINIQRQEQKTYPLTAKDVRDGKAYESECGNIFIGCVYDEIVAVSLRGDLILLAPDRVPLLREVDIDVIVKY